MTPRQAPWPQPRSVGGVRVAAGPIAAGTRMRRHEHAGVHLCCVVAGGFVEAHRSGPEEAGPGTVRISRTARHDLDFGPAGAHCVILTLDASEGDPDDMLGTVALSRPVFLRDPWLGGLVARLGRALALGRSISDVALDELAAELLAQVGRRRKPRAASNPPRWLLGAREMIGDSDGSLPSLGDMARALGVHRGHLARAFRDHYGVTIGQMARSVRLERAVRLLRSTDASLASVAADAGFADQSHMTRSIRAAFGTSPRRLRSAGYDEWPAPRPDVTRVQDAAHSLR